MKKGVYLTAVLVVIGSGSVGARTISYDEPNFNLSPSTSPFTTSNSASLTLTGYSLSFAPGVTGDSFSSGAAFTNGTTSGYTPQGPYLPSYSIDNAYMYNWGSNPVSQIPGNIVEQVMVYHAVDGSTVNGLPDSSNGLEVDFNYLSGTSDGCAGQTASFTVNGATYTDKFSASNPCTSGTNAFFLNDGTVVSAASGWTKTAAAAPEIDGKSTFSGVALIIGVLAVMRRRAPAMRST